MEEIKALPEYKLNQICTELKTLMLKHQINFADIAQCLAILTNKQKEIKK